MRRPKTPRKPVKEVRKKSQVPGGSGGELRLNKFLAEAGVASRRKADELIAEGKVKINGRTVKEMGAKVSRADLVTVGGDPVTYHQKMIYIILNKPKGVLTTTSDDRDRKTVMDIVRKRIRIFPVGRLDRNTTGALLMTNDGDLAYRLTHPKYRIPREYNVTLDKHLEFDDAKQLAAGVELEDGKTAPCEVFIRPDDNRKVRITLFEGKNREVRRMFEHFGYEVTKLDRKIFAGLTNKGLNRGEYRNLAAREIIELKKLVKLS